MLERSICSSSQEAKLPRQVGENPLLAKAKKIVSFGGGRISPQRRVELAGFWCAFIFRLWLVRVLASSLRALASDLLHARTHTYASLMQL